uniref:3D domain-containing protein n=1 Tax=Pyramimonas obovata TaxID=1411642 RepID=A0A7S0RKT7_9CHLO|mmetsp:Transcript_36640/g.79809  ORF Transcript_36640/g.79809 Transcript_36640/m.79809 type:complete len:262 (+) Transcript_36640:156-941(+)|eukprot:CAMPEP_0118921182 /NCGR_PEP_ID=MMETSP1169-20130426/546_1 /TAXON_ID=36882 /ORGANISM="Pyramimonas obovata, Strain CCMP722" /LENGTH=261 /DNA_ID=CAMNT_0006861863 /DNA_START=145 /DNA_END=930 /DNA_ORIENTATION=+
MTGQTNKPRGETTTIEATAYCSCGHCCGWSWGMALGPLPLFSPLTSFKKRASGRRCLPLWPKRRYTAKLKNGETVPAGWKLWDRVRGGAAGAAVGAAVGACLNTKGSFMPNLHNIPTAMRIGAIAGTALTPISPYWVETNLKGHSYGGVTSTGAIPKEPLPPLFSRESLTQPDKFVQRIVNFQWRARDGTIAADTTVYPFGTRMYIQHWGWGVVEDRGGAIKGQSRVDLYHYDHQKALKWGRRKTVVQVVRKAPYKKAAKS